MNVLANLKGLSNFIQILEASLCCRHLFQVVDLPDTNKEANVKQQK